MPGMLRSRSTSAGMGASPRFTRSSNSSKSRPRDKGNQEHIWRGLQNGTFQVFSSDHSAYRYVDKIKGGPDVPFTNVPNGVPGIAHVRRCLEPDRFHEARPAQE